MEERPVYETTEELLGHERSYKSFNIVLRWCMVLLAAIVVTSTLWFATPAGAVKSLLVGVLVLALGYWGLVRHEARQPLDLWTEGR